ncbi:MAG: hypothetical protein LBR18_02080 [Tannerella sp.]|nr:hypothetical protein [Tannerella sp.]
MEEILTSEHTIQSKCPSCGGSVVYSPENEMLICSYCAQKYPLDLTPAVIHENDLDECLAHPELYEQAEDYKPEVTCGQCGATTTFPENTVSFDCAFCGTPIVLRDAVTKRSWKPEYILPFKIGKSACLGLFRKWVSSLWFAPNDFSKTLLADERMKGVYLPYWTYDADTLTRYSGERGVSRSVSRMVNGRRETYVVTDWYPVSGTVRHVFDDVLVPASESLPRDISSVLTNWDRKNYVAYSDQFVRGFLTELYRQDFKTCFLQAKKQMESYISALVRSEIGGSQQRVFSQTVKYSKIKFKHVLLPVWLSAYRYGNRVFIFAINGRTGQVIGQRPWSAWKIAMLIIACITALIVLFGLAS